MSNGFAVMGGVGAVQLPINNGRDAEIDGEVSVRGGWSSFDNWIEVVLDFDGERRFIALTDEQATVLATLLCEAMQTICAECDAPGGVGPIVATPRHIHERLDELAASKLGFDTWCDRHIEPRRRGLDLPRVDHAARSSTSSGLRVTGVTAMGEPGRAHGVQNGGGFWGHRVTGRRGGV